MVDAVGIRSNSAQHGSSSKKLNIKLLYEVVIEEKKLSSLPLNSLYSFSDDIVTICGSLLSYIIGYEKIQEPIKVGELKITFVSMTEE